MIKRHAKVPGLPETACRHTFRASGITAYLANGGTIEHAQTIADHDALRSARGRHHAG